MPSGGAVREYAGSNGPGTPATTITHLVGNAERAPRSTVIRRRYGNRWEDVSFEQFHDEVREVAKGLAACGVRPGDRVAIMSGNCFDWTLADYAIWYCGAISVPIQETASAEQAGWILNDCGAVALFVQRRDQLAVLTPTALPAPHVDQFWVFDDGAVRSLQRAGGVVGDDDIDFRRDTLLPDSVATIIYTSGTTGRPKGCVLTHRNLALQARALSRALPDLLGPQSPMLLQIPLAQAFARVLQVACVHTGTPLCHGDRREQLPADLAGCAPSLLAAPARSYGELMAAAGRAWDGRGPVFSAAVETAISYSRAVDAGGPGMPLRLRHALFDRLVYSGLRESLGGRLTRALCPGGLDARLAHTLRGFGLPVLEGYGLTEASGAAALNRPEATRVGTAGRPMPGTSVSIAADGEVLISGGCVFAGYWNDPAATADVLTPTRWLHTGDLGALDPDGYLQITGRKQDRFVTAAGRRVAPADLEARLRAHRLVSQCVVVGAGKPYLAALLTLDPVGLADWLAASGGTVPARLPDMSRDPAVHAEIAAAVDAANASVPRSEAIRRFTVLGTDWTEAGGQLTATMGVRRGVVLQQHAPEVDALYA